MAELTTERIHKVGAERHGGCWLNANLRAVEAILASGFRPDSPELKIVVPVVVLKILDGNKVDEGLTWDANAQCWL